MALTQSYLTLNIHTLVQQVPVWNDSHEKEMSIAHLSHSRFARSNAKKLFWWAFVGELRLARFSFRVCHPTYVRRPALDRSKRCSSINQKRSTTMLQPNSVQSIPVQTEQSTQNLNKLHNAFAQICHSYGDLNHYYGFSEFVDSKRIDWLLEEINNLSLEVSALRLGGEK